MRLGRVVGTVVATRKDPRLEGKKLLICRLIEDPEPNRADEASGDDYVVAVDTVSAGFGERILIVQGSSARMAANCQDTPVDAAIVGIVDIVSRD